MSTTTNWLAPAPVVERIPLDDACWVDVIRGIIPDAQRVHDDLVRSARWNTRRTYRYERWVADVRRSASQSGARRHPALAETETWLVRRYRVRFSGVMLSEYRHGREGLGFHRDRAMTWLDDTLVALAQPRGAATVAHASRSRPPRDRPRRRVPRRDRSVTGGRRSAGHGWALPAHLAARRAAGRPRRRQPRLGAVALDIAPRRARHRTRRHATPATSPARTDRPSPTLAVPGG